MQLQMRIARPVRDLQRSAALYCEGLGLSILGRFADHDGFDGVMLGTPGVPYHFEFTHCHRHPVAAQPTPEDLVVFYVPDARQWRSACGRALAAGFTEVVSFNPYWETRGKTLIDADGYRVVLQNAAWGSHG